MEVIDIGITDLDTAPVSLRNNEDISAHDVPSSSPHVNFGPGIELLMNDRNVASSRSTNVGMDDLDKLEQELNEASGTETQDKEIKSGGDGMFSKLFDFGEKTPIQTIHLDNDHTNNDSKLGSATVEGIGSTKTWDGFNKVNDVPNKPPGPQLNDREKRRKKRAMLKKMDEWYDKGHIKHNSNFTMESDFDEIEDEYETVLEEKRKKDSIKLQGWWFTTLVNSLEYANAAFDPFGLNLDGWGEQINEDVESYEEIFSELHDKYKGGKLAPEISLLLRLGFSGAVLNITNKALSTATPGFSDIMKQSPELMKMFSNATVQSMSNNSPGMEFVGEMLNPDNKPNTSFGPPPAPVKTQQQAPPTRPGMQFTEAQSNNRPDISMGRGTMFHENGVNIHQQQENIQTQDKTRHQPPPVDPPANSMQGPRVEMRGPKNVDLDNMLAGLKPREVNIHSQSQENDSMVSISSLRDAQNTNLPKQTNRRKQKSDKNTVSLDI
jgi:hypothetical protein